jgi:hypothetical protein
MTLETEFLSYHAENPRVYEYVDQFAREAIRAGYQNFAIATIWERIRWEIHIRTRDEHFKLPNNHRAYYARMWMRNNPSYPDFFRTAVLRSVHATERDRFGRDLFDNPL